MCEFITYTVADGPPYYASGGSHTHTVCKTHSWHPVNMIVDGLCPLGRVEKAIEDGLKRIAEAASVEKSVITEDDAA